MIELEEDAYHFHTMCKKKKSTIFMDLDEKMVETFGGKQLKGIRFII